jgi:hypothetical protein
MPAKLTTTIAKIAHVPNPVNAAIIAEFHQGPNVFITI